MGSTHILLINRERKKLLFRSTNFYETKMFGERLGRLLTAGNVIALVGELGSGKTTFVKGMVKGLGIKDGRAVKSPTFSLVHKYEGRIPIYHFDAYRLEDAQEMLNIGSDEMIYGNGVSIIEWADKVLECLPEEYLRITLTTISKDERRIELQGFGDCYDKIINNMGQHS